MKRKPIKSQNIVELYETLLIENANLRLFVSQLGFDPLKVVDELNDATESAVKAVIKRLAPITTEQPKKPTGFPKPKGTVGRPPKIRSDYSATLTDYAPNKVLDKFAEVMGLKNDAAICRVLEVKPPNISKIRNYKMLIGDTLLLRMHEISGIPILTLREIMAGNDVDETSE